MITVAEALDRLFALAEALGTEEVPLAEAHGRVLAAAVVAGRAQPPFAASAMDGYALRHADAGAPLRVVGAAPAGQRYGGVLGPGEAVRIFTGAPLPEGADTVAIQEEAAREGNFVRLDPLPRPGAHIRPAGADFRPGDRIEPPRRLRPADLALAAAMNLPRLTVRRRPIVAILPTGDELVMPGEAPGPDQIVASNVFGLKAMVEAEGAAARLLPIARDTAESLEAAFALARGADLILTIGGASVGDHDLVGPVAERLGMDRAFYKVAMRPGKPLMAGRFGGAMLIGLPGNPVSALVCGQIFVLPVLRAMLGLPAAPAPRTEGILGADLPANGPREHYMRARLDGGRAVPFASQDSSLLRILAEADAFVVRPPGDPARTAGDVVDLLHLG